MVLFLSCCSFCNYLGDSYIRNILMKLETSSLKFLVARALKIYKLPFRDLSPRGRSFDFLITIL